MGCIGGRSGRRWRRRCRRRSGRRRAGRRRSSARIGRSIDAWLEADREAPRKQRHTARRIWQRLVDEHGAEVAETTVRDYVRARRRAMGWPVGEVFVPQVHAPGVEAEVDWGEAQVDAAPASPTTVHLFFMRAWFSGAAFCQASLVETQQAFLEVHVEAFEWFGGVFERIRYDNLSSAVKQVLQGPPARRDRSLRRAALALPVRVAVHHAGHRRARTRRAASRARSGASAATTWSRSRRSPTWPSSTRCCSRGCEADLRAADRRARRDGRRGVGERAAAAARAARRAVRRDRGRGAARRRQVAGHGPPEPLLGPGRAGRAEGQRPDRRARDHDQPRRRGGRAPRAAARPLRHQRAARSLPRAARAQARRPRALAGARPGARARRLAGCFDELWAALTEPLRALGGRPADGRRAAALPRARARPASSWPSAARSPPARTTAAPSRCSRAAPSTASRAPAPLTGLRAAPGRARPAGARPDRLRPAARPESRGDERLPLEHRGVRGPRARGHDRRRRAAAGPRPAVRRARSRRGALDQPRRVHRPAQRRRARPGVRAAGRRRARRAPQPLRQTTGSAGDDRRQEREDRGDWRR